MKIKSFGSVLASLFIGLLAVSFSTLSVAAPFSITYAGTIGTEHADTFFPEVNEGESYSLTLVFDNGSANALTQTWGEADLTCAIFLINDAQDVQFIHDLTVDPDASVDGSVSTDGAGVLTGNFTYATYHNITSDEYEVTGIQLVDALDWYANDNNDVFFSNHDNDAFGDAAGGVLMAPENWSDPVPYDGACEVKVRPQISVAPVPALSPWALVLLSGLLLLFGGFFAFRRRV